MTGHPSVLVLPLLVVALAAPALAQDVTAKKVTLDLNGVAPAAAFQAVADAIGVKVTVDAAVTESVDITVRNVSARTALTAICESIGCKWTLTGGTLDIRPQSSFMVGVVQRDARATAVDKDKASARAKIVLNALKQKLPADLKFENAPLSEIGRRLSEVLEMNVELSCKDPNVRTLTMDFGNLTLQSALQSIAEREVGSQAAWRLTIGPPPGDTQTPTIAIMVGPRTAKKK